MVSSQRAGVWALGFREMCVRFQALLLTSCDLRQRTSPQLSLGFSPVAQTVKNLPAMQETRLQSLGREDPLEKGMAARSSVLA